jgi:hypothetical protein
MVILNRASQIGCAKKLPPVREKIASNNERAPSQKTAHSARKDLMRVATPSFDSMPSRRRTI